jgi:hypothetical protein
LLTGQQEISPNAHDAQRFAQRAQSQHEFAAASFRNAASIERARFASAV